MVSERPRLPTDKERAKRYREHAEHFRELAMAEPIEGIRQQLLDVADQYQELADRLLPRGSGEAKLRDKLVGDSAGCGSSDFAVRLC